MSPETAVETTGTVRRGGARAVVRLPRFVIGPLFGLVILRRTIVRLRDPCLQPRFFFITVFICFLGTLKA